MIFIGGGSLLTRAVSTVLERGLPVDMVCCVPGDPCIPRLRKLNVPTFETSHPSEEFIPILQQFSGKTAFSINNRKILHDAVLDCGVNFYNIHNGLVQKYRGVAEVCVFAAICNQEQRYGITLHRVLPRQKVDAGPVVAQRMFDISTDEVFSSLLKKSLDACHAIFEDNVELILQGLHAEKNVAISESAYSYKDLAAICKTAGAEALLKARALGPYAAFFPRLTAAVAMATSTEK